MALAGLSFVGVHSGDPYSDGAGLAGMSDSVPACSGIGIAGVAP